MNTLTAIILATIVTGLGSFVGALTLAVASDKLNRFIMLLVSLSAGALMGGAFLHLLPEAAETLPFTTVAEITLMAFIGFMLIEKLFMWRHCHDGHCDAHAFGILNLVGDAFHNFIDGLVIAAAFLTDFGLGMATTLAVATHEIPQEIGDFGVLVFSGMSRKKALFANVSVAATGIIGGIVGYFLASHNQSLTAYLLPVAAGGFIYIASSDLLPEMRKETKLNKSMLSFALFLVGICLMFVFNKA